MPILAALLALAVSVSFGWTADAPTDALGAIPDEPGAFVLPDAAILSAAAADVDGDGSREVVRLVVGGDDATLLETWRFDGSRWTLLGDPLQVLPPGTTGGGVADDDHAIAIRLLVHRVGGDDRLLVGTQPRDQDPGAASACCLVLESIGFHDGSARVGTVVRSHPVDAVLVVDLDGDGTDEIVTARSLPPLGRVSFPTEAAVYRWTDEGFGAPTYTELPIGSGDSPYVLGDSDGRAGDELAIIGTLGRRSLFRISLGVDDALVVDDYGALARDALGVRVGEGRAVVVAVGDEVVVRHWPPNGPPDSAPLAATTLPDARILGTVDVGGRSRVLAEEPRASILHVLDAATLARAQGGAVTLSAAAETLASVPIRPYVGPIPRGGPGGGEAFLYAGRLLASAVTDTPPPPMGGTPAATLVGAEPIGLVGDGSWLAVVHSPHAGGRMDRLGGRFPPSPPLADAWISIAPLDVVLRAEEGAARLDPALDDGAHVAGDGLVRTGRLGFGARITAPPGSRVLGMDLEPWVIGATLVVPDDGRVVVPVVPTVVSRSPRYRASVMVTTPGGHAYVAIWDVEVLTSPPPLDVEASTPFGALDVVIAGRTSAGASVTVDGSPVPVGTDGHFAGRVRAPPWPTDVRVTSSDVVGNVSRTSVSAVGIFDYRALPWIPILAALVLAAGVGLYVRVPRHASPPRSDDAVLEELDSD